MAVRLFHVSDLHFGRADIAALAWFAGCVRRERPEAVIVTGDLTMRARGSEYAAAAEWLERLGVPISIEPGNHDLPYFNPIARIFHPYRRFRRIEKALERPLDLPGLCLVPLRTVTRAQWRFNWSWGVVRQRTLEEALVSLQACPPNHVAVIACHHPLVASEAAEDHGRTIGGRKALDMLSERGADVVLSGHVHDPFDIVWHAAGGDVRLIGAGTLSERHRESPPSFNELLVENGGLDLRVRTMA